MADADYISSDYLHEILHYSPQTGVFTWLRGRHPSSVAGNLHRSGFLRIRIDRRDYYAQRLAWLWVHGEWPKRNVRHKNGDKLDNRFENLSCDCTPDFTLEYFRSLVNYCPEVGLLTYKSSGKPLTLIPTPTGYLKVKFARATFYAHRLAWLWVTGEFPKGQIDHINRDKSDNRIVNLRDVTVSGNARNRLSTHRPGLPGAQKGQEGFWQTSIVFMGKIVRVAGFRTPEEASEMYLALKVRLHDTYTDLSKT